MLLDVILPARTISLGSGDQALFLVFLFILGLCALPFIGGGGRR